MNKNENDTGEQQVPPPLQDGHPFGSPPAEPKTRQEENWRLMTILQVPWNQANKIDDEEDRKFLLEKAKEVEGFLQAQQAQQQMMQPQTGAGAGPLGEPQVEIVKPN
jgi:hypothetical protein